MLVIDDALDAFYLGSFLFGLLFSALSHLLGLVHVGAHLPKSFHGHGHGGHDAPGGTGGGHRLLGLSHVAGAFNPASILAFVSWFGGVGYQARHALGFVTPVSIVCGLAGGSFAAAVVWWFFAKVIWPQDRALDPEDYRLTGMVARVSSSIRAGGTGEIVYVQAGVRQVSAARSVERTEVARGTSVVVVEHERGMALVEPAPARSVAPEYSSSEGGPTGKRGRASDAPVVT